MAAHGFVPTLELERPSLSEPLVGRRRTIHHALPVMIAASSAIAVLGYLLPAHRLAGTSAAHSNVADGGVLSIVILAVVAAAALALRGRRFGSGMLAGAVAMLGAALALAPVLVTHLIVDVEHAIGHYVFNAGIVATFLAGAALAIGEPLLHRDRRRG